MNVKTVRSHPSRRQFVQTGILAAFGCVVGCDPESRSATRNVAAAAELLLALPIPIHLRSVAAVLLTLTKAAELVLQWECLTAEGTGKSSPVFQGGKPVTGEKHLTPGEAEQIRHLPVVLQNSHGETLNSKVMPDSAAKLELASVGTWSRIRYRCEGERTQQIVPVWVPRFVSITRFLKVYCNPVWNPRDGRFTITYGRSPAWQELRAADGNQIDIWKKELAAAGFETRVA